MEEQKINTDDWYSHWPYPRLSHVRRKRDKYIGQVENFGDSLGDGGQICVYWYKDNQGVDLLKPYFSWLSPKSVVLIENM